MTFLHLLVLALGLLAAIAGSDLLSHRGVGPWPIGLVALLLVPIAGWFYSPWIAALALGLALGTGILLVASWTRTFMTRRHARREQARRLTEAKARQLDGEVEHRR